MISRSDTPVGAAPRTPWNSEKQSRMEQGLCVDCGVVLHPGTAKVFTVCDACWTAAYPPKSAVPPPQPLETAATGFDPRSCAATTIAEHVIQREWLVGFLTDADEIRVYLALTQDIAALAVQLQAVTTERDSLLRIHKARNEQDEAKRTGATVSQGPPREKSSVLGCMAQRRESPRYNCERNRGHDGNHAAFLDEPDGRIEWSDASSFAPPDKAAVPPPSSSEGPSS